MREFVIRQAIANCLNMGYGLQIRSQREMCNSHLQCSLEDRIIFNEDAFVKYALSTPPTVYKTIKELTGQKCRFFYRNKAVAIAFNAVVEITPEGHLFVSSGEGADSIDLRSAGISIRNITAPPVLATDKEIKAFVFVEDAL